MTDLRTQAIIEMAAAHFHYERDAKWWELGHADQMALREEMAAALDVLLDFLTEHADEWIDATGVVEWHDWSERGITTGLLAVLADTEETE